MKGKVGAFYILHYCIIRKLSYNIRYGYGVKHNNIIKQCCGGQFPNS